MKNLIFLLLSLPIFSCNSPTGLNANEQAGVAAVEKAFGGSVTTAPSDDGTTLLLTISKSKLLEESADLLQLHCSRAAWLFFQELDGGKASYQTIKVAAQLSDAEKSYDFTLVQLATVKNEMESIDKAAAYLIAGDYAQLYTLFDPAIMGVSTVEDLKGYCTQVEPEYGKPLAFNFEGFMFFKLSGQQTEQLSLAGHLKRDIKDTALIIFVDHQKTGLEGTVTSIKFDY